MRRHIQVAIHFFSCTVSPASTQVRSHAGIGLSTHRYMRSLAQVATPVRRPVCAQVCACACSHGGRRASRQVEVLAVTHGLLPSISFVWLHAGVHAGKHDEVRVMKRVDQHAFTSAPKKARRHVPACVYLKAESDGFLHGCLHACCTVGALGGLHVRTNAVSSAYTPVERLAPLNVDQPVSCSSCLFAYPSVSMSATVDAYKRVAKLALAHA